MILSQTQEELVVYLCRQLNHLFPDKDEVKPVHLLESVATALGRLNYCFSQVSNYRYHNGTQPIYNHLYSDHNIVFYWFLANTVWVQAKNDQLASKLYYLNKVMHGFDCMFDTAMPDIFLVFHGVGTMLGKAIYNDYFVAMQGCTVGSNKGHYPVFGKGVSLTANSSVIGNCKIGDKCNISTGTLVFDKNMGANETAFVNPANGLVETRLSRASYAEQFFKFPEELTSK